MTTVPPTTWPATDRPVRLVDLSHPWNADTPPFPLDESPTVVWAKRIASHGTNHQRISTQLHIGTHIDAPLHWREDGTDIASIPLDRLYGPLVVADVSEEFGDFGLIRPRDIEARVDVKPGDVLVIHTGYSRYYAGGPEPDLIRYFFKNPGGDRELAEWAVERRIRWLGVDSSGPEHPMTGNTRDYWPQVYAEAERLMGEPPDQRFPIEEQMIIHRILFAHDIPIVENISAAVGELVGRRADVCAFPWKFAGGEAALVRVVAFAEP